MRIRDFLFHARLTFSNSLILDLFSLFYRIAVNHFAIKCSYYAVTSLTVAVGIHGFGHLLISILVVKESIEAADFALIDGNRRPDLDIPCVEIVKGDEKSESIAAASILAKVSRDRLMNEYAKKYPQYGFERNKGYPSEFHSDMVRQYGPCEIHRPSFLKNILHPELKKPRTKAQRLGAKGEAAALELLAKKGYELVEKNYRAGHGEIDLIMQKDDMIVFVEVKARDSSAITRPSDSVTLRKRKKLIETAEAYMNEKKTTLQPRFDVVEAVYISGIKQPELTHIENAFGEE